MTTPTPVRLTRLPQGAVEARRIVADYLALNFASYLSDARLQWGLTLEQLPDPLAVLDRPAHALDRYPLLAVSNVRDAAPRRGAPEGDNVAFETTYSMRAFCWVRTEGWDEVFDLRDRYAAVLRAALFDDVRLGSDDAVLDEGGMTIDYSDVQKVKGERFVAGAFVGFPLRVRESLRRLPGVTVATVDLTAQNQGTLLPALTVHPGLE